MASAASSTSFGFATPSPSPSEPQTRHDPGMNCIGPTARSQVGSPSRTPPSESEIAANPPPSSRGPRIGVIVTPAAFTAPLRAWSDSTLPIPAIICQLTWQDGSVEASVVAAAS